MVIVWNIYRKVPELDHFGHDALAYWSVDPVAPYGQTVGELNAFLYAPPMAGLLGLANQLPWPLFQGLLLVLQLAAVAWMAREWTLVVLALPPVFNELFFGNVNLFIALAIALGFTWSGTWAFVLLTKVTPGVGLLWFAVRREWRAVATALGVTAAIAAVSFVL
ncbi:MAG: glycosyltransferase family 87 protein, partial [Candidatus Limnocylindrales bacterium]